MKVTYRIPTEQFGFVEIVEETNTSEENVVEVYRGWVEAFRPKPVNSIPDKEFNQFIDNMLLGKQENGADTYAAMSPEQQKQVQCIKRALKRLQAKNQ